VNRRSIEVVGEQESCDLLVGKVALEIGSWNWRTKSAELSKGSQIVRIKNILLHREKRRTERIIPSNGPG
jgi:hypothetical protein